MIFTFDNSENKEHLYLQVYHYYRDLILSRRLPPGSRMPSLRTCARDLHLSRTTVESAYLQLAADGYIVSKAQSGYYVTDIAVMQQMFLRYEIISQILGIDLRQKENRKNFHTQVLHDILEV